MPPKIIVPMVFLLFLLFWVVKPPAASDCDGITCVVRRQPLVLASPMRGSRGVHRYTTRQTNARLDTLSNWYSANRQYVEIIRQDHPAQPRYGIALGFVFSDTVRTFPYLPAFARIQLKDFAWGGLEFSSRDSFNYTGVLDDVSDDLTVTVEGFQNDTIFGRFNGLLLSGAGPMTALDSGCFRVRLLRTD